MNNRKRAFMKGLRKITGSSAARMSRKTGRLGKMRLGVYNPADMREANKIICGDCIKTLNDGPEGWVDLVFADPPFNIGYLYHGYDDRKKTEDYLQFSHDWMAAVYRALKPTGSFYLAIGDEYAADLCVIARRQIGFHMRNWIIWHYTFGQQTKKMFAKSHTHILYFTKHEPDKGLTNITFNADAVRVKSARQTTYDDARANPKGKLPDDTWFLRPQEAAPHGYFEIGYDTWYESRVCGTFKEREGWHGCQMPIGVLNRIVLASSNPGDVVLDPFNGSGTTVVSAAMLGRKYVGIDQSEQYVAFARSRVEHALAAAEPQELLLKACPDKRQPLQLTLALEAVVDPNRKSKVMTETDAFGRPRVARGRRPRSDAADPEDQTAALG